MVRKLFAVALAAMLAGCASVTGIPASKEISAKPSQDKALVHKTPAKEITPRKAQEHVARRSVWDRFWPKKSTTNWSPRSQRQTRIFE